MALLADRYSKYQQRNSKRWEQQSHRLAKDKNASSFNKTIVNIFEFHSTTDDIKNNNKRIVNGTWGSGHDKDRSKQPYLGGVEVTQSLQKLIINKKQRRTRLRFAKTIRIEDCNKIIFSDECNFWLFPSPLVLTQTPGETYKSQCLTATVKYSGEFVMMGA